MAPSTTLPRSATGKPSVVDHDAPTRPHLPIDPRIRQRRVEVRRAEGRRRRRVLLGLAGAVAVAGGALGALHTPLAAVRHVRLRGASAALPARLVLRAAGLDHQALMVDVGVGTVTRRLEQLPLVATATVARQWPATVRIVVTVRTPVAVVGTGPSRAEVDRTGRVLVVGPGVGGGLPLLDLPLLNLAVPSGAALSGAVLSGAAPSGRSPMAGAWVPGSAGPGAGALAATTPPAGGPAGGPAGAAGPAGAGGPSGAGAGGPVAPVAAELALAAALGPALQGRVATIGVTRTDGLVATVGAAEIVFGDASDLQAKVAALAAVAATGPVAGRLDLRVPDRPAEGAPTPAPPSAGTTG